VDVHSGSPDDAVTITTTVDTAPATAFEILAAELSASWRRVVLTCPAIPRWPANRRTLSCKVIRPLAV